MSDDPAKPPVPVAWKTIDRVAAQAEREEMDRLLAMTDEDLDADLKEAGFAPEDAANILKAAMEKTPAPAPAPAPAIVSLAAERTKRARPVAFFLVAAAAAIAVLGGGGAAYVALHAPDPQPTSPVPSVAPTPPPQLLANHEAIEKRTLAQSACKAHKWDACLDALKQAANLDPAGDSSPEVRRMRSKATRSLIGQTVEAKSGPGGPSFAPDQATRLVKAISALKGQAVRIVCARSSGPQRYCGQLAAAMTQAGWVVTRATRAADAGRAYGIAVTVTAGANDSTEDAAEALADGLAQAGVSALGPDDVPGASVESGVTLTVGEF